MDIVNRQRLNLLIQLAKADGHFAREEKELIRQIAEKNEFPPDDLRNLMANPEPIESLGALSDTQKDEYFLDCMKLILADGKIADKEITFSQSIALKLGYHKDVVPHVLENWENPKKIDLGSWKLPGF